MSKHYTRIPGGQVEWVSRRLPRSIVTADGQHVCHTPQAVEDNGELHLYAIHTFDSVEPEEWQTAIPLEVEDVAWDGTTATGVHRFTEISVYDHLQRKFFHLESAFTEMKNTGFDFAGLRFPLEAEGRDKMMGIHQVKDDVALTFPIEWGNIDDTATVELKNPSDVRAFYLTGLGTFRALEDACTQYKKRLRHLTTHEAIAAEWAIILGELGQ